MKNFPLWTLVFSGVAANLVQMFTGATGNGPVLLLLAILAGAFAGGYLGMRLDFKRRPGTKMRECTLSIFAVFGAESGRIGYSSMNLSDSNIRTMLVSFLSAVVFAAFGLIAGRYLEKFLGRGERQSP